MIKIWKPVPNFEKGRKGHKPEIICLHIGDGTKEQIYSEFLNAEKSSHYCVNKDGSVWQFVLDENTAWTNGDIKAPTSEVVISKGKLNSVTKTCPGLISIPRIIVEPTRPPVSLTPAQKASILSVLIAFLADNAII